MAFKTSSELTNPARWPKIATRVWKCLRTCSHTLLMWSMFIPAILARSAKARTRSKGQSMGSWDFRARSSEGQTAVLVPAVNKKTRTEFRSLSIFTMVSSTSCTVRTRPSLAQLPRKCERITSISILMAASLVLSPAVMLDSLASAMYTFAEGGLGRCLDKINSKIFLPQFFSITCS